MALFWALGPHLHKFIGPQLFVFTYLFTGIIGSVMTELFFFHQTTLSIQDDQLNIEIVPSNQKISFSLGASGSVMGIATLTLLLFPRKEFHFSRYILGVSI